MVVPKVAPSTQPRSQAPTLAVRKWVGVGPRERQAPLPFPSSRMGAVVEHLPPFRLQLRIKVLGLQAFYVCDGPPAPSWSIPEISPRRDPEKGTVPTLRSVGRFRLRGQGLSALSIARCTQCGHRS